MVCFSGTTTLSGGQLKKYRKMSSNEQITPLNVTVPLYPFYGKAMSMPYVYHKNTILRISIGMIIKAISSKRGGDTSNDCNLMPHLYMVNLCHSYGLYESE